MGPAGVFEISASCRRAPASAIRSISNIWPQTVWTRRKVSSPTRRHRRGRLSGHAGRHRLAHHHGQRPRRARLGRRRHRGGGRHARPAAVDAAAGSGRASGSTASCKEGVTATDLVLTVTQMLRKQGVVGKFVEFFGPGLANLSVADRATIGNMAPEYGATCGFFPIDDETIDYLATTGRTPTASRWSRPMPRRRACSAPPRRPTGVHRDARARPRRRGPSLAGPEAAAGPRRARGAGPASPRR